MLLTAHLGVHLLENTPLQPPSTSTSCHGGSQRSLSSQTAHTGTQTRPNQGSKQTISLCHASSAHRGAFHPDDCVLRSSRGIVFLLKNQPLNRHRVICQDRCLLSLQFHFLCLRCEIATADIFRDCLPAKTLSQLFQHPVHSFDRNRSSR